MAMEAKKVALFGATGGAGKQLLRQTLEAGYEVTVLARNPAKIDPTLAQNPNLHIVQGDILDAAGVEEVVAGADLVLSVLGPTNNDPGLTITKGTQNIVDAMKKHNVRRLVMSAGAAAHDPQDRPNLVDRAIKMVLTLTAKNVKEDMERAVDVVRQSDRDWTVVRVPMLVDRPASGKLKVGYVGDIGSQISRADMAAFMLQEAKENRFIQKAPAISN